MKQCRKLRPNFRGAKVPEKRRREKIRDTAAKDDSDGSFIVAAPARVDCIKEVGEAVLEVVSTTGRRGRCRSCRSNQARGAIVPRPALP